MTTFVWLLFSSAGLVVAMSIVVLWIVLRPGSRAARRALVLVTAAYLLASIYGVPYATTKLLARGYHPFKRSDAPAGPTALVVLGAGVETVFGWGGVHLAIPNVSEGERVLETYRVYQKLDPAWVITSGGNLGGDDGSEPSSVNMKRMLVQLGVPADRILMQSTSHDTHEETRLLADMLRSLNAQHVVAVTSAVHMRRTVGAFRAAGMTVVPAIAPDTRHVEPWWYFLLPTPHGLKFSGQVAHELGGLAYYIVRGWWK
jgi:uncharacterized SAM-binding protein YcdF (DUF218 family)